MLASESRQADGLVSDRQIGEALAKAAGSGESAGRAADTQRFYAELALRGADAQAAREDQGLVVVLPRDWDPDGHALPRRVEALLKLPWLRPVALGRVLDAQPAGRVELEAAASPGRGPSGKRLATLTDLAARLSAFAKITADPEAVAVEQNRALLAPLAITLTPPDARNDLADRFIASARATLDRVGVVAGSEMNLISEEGQVPIVVRNDTPDPVTLTVGLAAQNPGLVAEAEVPVTVEAGGQATARIPIRALANGNVKIDVILKNAAGEPVAQASSLTVRVHADWENVGTTLVMGALGLAFVTGLFRSIRRRRASRSGTAA
ncbi:MAG: DUF6049 family protein [Bifidobacteriaceae bacterium]|nr:DUF6049 family protein [Bifidobacteriaceae bacterium]